MIESIVTSVPILKSEFLWGTVLGVLLSIISSWAGVKFNASNNSAHQKATVRSFSVDIIKNLRAIIFEMNSIRGRTNTIFHDFLTLIDTEVGVFNRNREHLILVPEEHRDKLRKFINECAIGRAEIVTNLNNLYDKQAKLSQLQGDDPSLSKQLQDACTSAFAQANKAADELVATAKGAEALLTDLQKGKW